MSSLQLSFMDFPANVAKMSGHVNEED
uniref:Uncharacterized protein n=1 Tax=Anguilla anguilla TaxID=7936 RepID=A0A0E9W5H7_ANGAN